MVIKGIVVILLDRTFATKDLGVDANVWDGGSPIEAV
jgi:hypothetical protein